MRRALAMWLIALSAASFVAPSVALPALQRAWRASPQSLGLMLSAGILGAGAAALFASRIAGRIGSRRALGLASAGFAAACLAFVAMPSADGAAIAAFGMGASAGLLDAAGQRYIAVTTATEGGAPSQLGFALGTALGPVTVAWLVHTSLGWRGAFVALALVAGALGARFWPRLDGHAPEVPGGADESSAPVSWTAVVVACCAAGSVGAPLVYSSWLVYYLIVAKGVAWLPAAAALALFWGAIAAGRIACHWVASHVSAPTLLWASTLAAAAAYGSLPFMPDRRWLFVAIALAGLGSSSQFLLLASWLGSRWQADSARVSVLLVAAADVWAAAGIYAFGALARWSPAFLLPVGGKAPLRVEAPSLGMVALAGAVLLLALLFREMERRDAGASRRDPAGEDTDALGSAAIAV